MRRAVAEIVIRGACHTGTVGDGFALLHVTDATAAKFFARLMGVTLIAFRMSRKGRARRVALYVMTEAATDFSTLAVHLLSVHVGFM